MKTLLAAITLFMVASPAAAQTTPGLSCDGATPDPGCNAARIRRQRALYDLPSLEQLRDQGVEVRRIFYSRALPWADRNPGALVFERRPGHGPVVRFQPPRGEDGRVPEPLVADLTFEAWRDVLARSDDLQRRFVPLAVRPNLCRFGWDIVVESATPAAENVAPIFYRGTEAVCADTSPATSYARGLATLAERFFPACALLHYRLDTQPVERLAECAALQGDRIAAAEVRNAIEPFLGFHNAAEAARLYDAFAYDAELDWNGEQVTTPIAPADRWAQGASQSNWPAFTIVSILGETATRVRVRGELWQTTVRQGPDEHRRAPVEMLWIRHPDGRFLLRRATVGAFQAMPPEPADRPARPAQ
jgi:hypothetical protein